jgi:hypothetical protein
MDDTDAARERIAKKLRTTFELQRFGIAMMRQNLVRRHPSETANEIDARLRAWLQYRPGAEYGDAEGHQSTWPRERA